MVVVKVVTKTQKVHLIITGSVQGIGYRWFAKKTAAQRNITGWVRNLDNGDVEIEACGSKDEIESFIDSLRNNHPYAVVSDIEIKGREEITCPAYGFEILD